MLVTPLTPDIELYLPNSVPVFLAGPVRGADDWQSEAHTKLEYMCKSTIKKKILCFSPRCLEARIGMDKQVEWETKWLQYCDKHGVIMFWIPCAKERFMDYSNTTRFQLGEWLAKRSSEYSVVVGIAELMSGHDYVQLRYPTLPIKRTLSDTCVATATSLSLISPK